jgi:predicted dehydrogenase
VFCQKPLATTLDDARLIRDALARTDRRFMMAFTLRYSPHYRRIRELLVDGAIGELISMELNENLSFNHGGFIHGDWRRFREVSGTHLLEKCCHDIDLGIWMAGSLPTRVASFGGLRFFTPDHADRIDAIGPAPERMTGWAGGRQPYHAPGCVNPFTAEKDIVDHQVAILEYANGVRATFHTNCNAAIPERRMLLLGSEGTIRADVVSGQLELHRIGWETLRESHAIDEASGGHGGGDDVLARELADCIERGASPAAGIEQGFASAVTCFAIDRAMDEGVVVDVDLMWRELGMGGAMPGP